MDLHLWGLADAHQSSLFRRSIGEVIFVRTERSDYIKNLNLFRLFAIVKQFWKRIFGDVDHQNQTIFLTSPFSWNKLMKTNMRPSGRTWSPYHGSTQQKVITSTHRQSTSQESFPLNHRQNLCSFVSEQRIPRCGSWFHLRLRIHYLPWPQTMTTSPLSISFSKSDSFIICTSLIRPLLPLNANCIALCKDIPTRYLQIWQDLYKE